MRNLFRAEWVKIAGNRWVAPGIVGWPGAWSGFSRRGP